MGEFGGFFPSLAIQPADPIGGYMGGLERGYQMQMLPYQMALAQQEYQLKGLDIASKALGLRGDQMFYDRLAQHMGASSAPYAGRSEGVTNGPQGAVSANTSPLTPGAETSAPPSPVSAPTGGGRSSVSYGEVTPGALADAYQSRSALATDYDLQRLAAYRAGKWGPEAENQILKNQQQQEQWNWAHDPSYTGKAFAQSLLGPDADQIIQNNWGQLAPMAPYFARAAGVDLNDLKSEDKLTRVTAANKMGLAVYNQGAIRAGDAPLPLPERWRPLPGGFQQQSTTTGETKGSGGVQPSLSMLDYKSLSGETGKRPVWSTFPGNYQGGALPAGVAGTAARTGRVPGGGAAPAPAAAPAAGMGLPAGTISTGFDVNPQQRATANAAKGAFDAVRTAQQYAKDGVYFNDAAREAILDQIAPAEGGGILGKDGLIGSVAGALGSEYASRKLYKVLTDPKQRQLLAGIIPMLEARAQTLSNAATRGLSSQQIRLAFEELIPSGKEQEAEVTRNQENLVHGLALESGPVIANYPDVQRWLEGRQAQARHSDARQNATLSEIEAELARRRGRR